MIIWVLLYLKQCNDLLYKVYCYKHKLDDTSMNIGRHCDDPPTNFSGTCFVKHIGFSSEDMTWLITISSVSSFTGSMQRIIDVISSRNSQSI